jgi:predicted nucleic acid-binding protein
MNDTDYATVEVFGHQVAVSYRFADGNLELLEWDLVDANEEVIASEYGCVNALLEDNDFKEELFNATLESALMTCDAFFDEPEDF